MTSMQAHSANLQQLKRRLNKIVQIIYRYIYIYISYIYVFIKIDKNLTTAVPDSHTREDGSRKRLQL